ncbi:MAG: antibiotic biosynthesis monooxygenase family protein [Pseudomonadota bacterium]
MSCTVLLEVTAQTGRGQELVDVFASILGDTRAFDGCRGVDVVVNQDAAENVLLIESWDSRAHYEKYLAWRQERGDLDTLGALLAAAPSIRYFSHAEA